MFQVAAGVIVGGAVLWCLALGTRHKQYRACAIGGFIVAAAIVGSVLLDDQKPTAKAADCGSNDPLCIRD